MQLSEHFTTEEFNLITGKIGDVSWQLPISAARCLCVEILEPIRKHFGKPIKITSGFRDAGKNARVGGEPTSWHLYRDGQAAADFDIPGVPIEEVYDWIRLESGLRFDKIILEMSNFGVPGAAPMPDVVHVQLSINAPARRLAYRGMTNGMLNGRKYEQDEVNKLA